MTAVLLPWVLAMAGVCAAAGNDQKITEWLAQGKESLDQHRYPQAMDSFLKVLEVSPNDLDAKRSLLEISRAAWNWEQAGRLKPGELEADRAQALKSIRERRAIFAKSRAELDQVKDALQSRSSKALLSSSMNLTRTSEEEFMDAHFTAQAKIYLDQLQDRMRTALLHGDLKEPKDVLAAKGFLYYHRGLLEPALQQWQEALSRDPNDLVLKAQIAWLGSKIKIINDREHIAELAEEAAKQYKTGRYAESLQSWTQLLMLDPRNQEAITGSAEAQNKLKAEVLRKRISEAKKASKSGSLQALRLWVAVLELDPSNTESLTAIKTWREAQRNKKEAAPVARAAASYKPTAAASSPQEADEQYAIGMAYYSQGELPAALQAMQKALDLNPSLRKAKIAVERIKAETGQ